MKIKTKLLSSFIGLVIGCELMTATPLLFSTFKRILSSSNFIPIFEDPIAKDFSKSFIFLLLNTGPYFN